MLALNDPLSQYMWLSTLLIKSNAVYIAAKVLLLSYNGKLSQYICGTFTYYVECRVYYAIGPLELSP